MTGQPQPLLGILGGMGPAATADFYAKFIGLSPAAQDQDHARVVIWADPTIPPRPQAVLNGTDEPYPRLLAGARVLASVGATVVAMPCNTAHAFLPRLIRDTGLLFLDMVAETVQTLSPADQPVGLLGTRGTLASGLYQRRLEEAGIPHFGPNASIQERTDEAVAHVKAGDISAAQVAVLDAVRWHHTRGMRTVILACTELPLALPDQNSTGQPRLLDPTEVLAHAAVAAYWRQTNHHATSTVEDEG